MGLTVTRDRRDRAPWEKRLWGPLHPGRRLERAVPGIRSADRGSDGCVVTSGAQTGVTPPTLTRKKNPGLVLVLNLEMFSLLMLIPKEIGHSSPLSVRNYNSGQKKRKHYDKDKNLNKNCISQNFFSHRHKSKEVEGKNRVRKTRRQTIFLMTFAKGWPI